MTDAKQHDHEKADASLIPGFIKGAAIAGVLTWVLLLLAVLTSSSHGIEGLISFLFLILSTLFLLLFALPALIISYVRRR